MILKLFGVRVRTWGFHPHKKSLKEIGPLGAPAYFYQKFEIFAILSYLRRFIPVEILLKRTGLAIRQ